MGEDDFGDWRNLETTTASELANGSLQLAAVQIPGLTVLCHPDLQTAVVVGEGGLLQKGPINAIESADPNFLALRELVNHTSVTAVQTAPEIRFLDPEGNIGTKQFLYETPEQIRADIVAQGISQEEAERLVPDDAFNIVLGQFLTPRDDAANANPHDDRKERAFTNEATVIVPDASMETVPDVENAMTTAHEL